MSVRIELEDPRRPDVAELIAEIDAFYAALYPSESCHPLPLEDLAAADVRFFAARSRGGDLLGSAALRIDPSGYGEIKRLFVRPAGRGLGLGRTLLQRIVDEAKALRLEQVLLETGVHQPEATRLYESFGFRVRGPFAGYSPDPLSVFMELPLLQAIVAVVRYDGKILVTERSEHVPMPGYWAPVSGRVERGETQPEAVVREVREEVGIDVVAIEKVWECYTHDGRYVLHWWTADAAGDQLTLDPHEVADARWIVPREYGALPRTFEDDRRYFADLTTTAQDASRAADTAAWDAS